MKKYLMTGIAALALGAGFTSCSHDIEPMTQEEINQIEAQKIVQTYEQAFIKTFGQPAANQNWGFGAANARTRAAMPSTPTFRDTYPYEEPADFPTNYYQKVNDVKANITYAKNKDWNSWEETGAVVYIDSDYPYVNDKKDQLIYVVGDVEYSSSMQTGIVFVVTEKSTLKLMNGVGQHVSVYLAPKAKLDVTSKPSWESNNENYTVSFDGDATVYLSSESVVEGNNLTFKNGCKVKNDGGTITAYNLSIDDGGATLWNEGTITVENDMKLANEEANVYNALGKTISTENLYIINNSDLFYNEGTLTATGEIALQNTEAEIINNGAMSGASFTMAAGSKAHNVGTMNITGKTDLTNGNSEWQNDGKWTSGSFDVDNYSETNFNNCKLTVIGNFYLHRGTFVLNSGASVVCNSFTWDDTSDFYLGSKALLNVSGTLKTDNYNSGYGFRAFGDDYAVIKANKIEKGLGDVQFSMSYFGNLYIDTQSHFGQGAIDNMNEDPAQPYYFAESTVKFTYKKQAAPQGFKIEADSKGCSDGYIPPTFEESSNADLRIMAEDLSAYDFTDFDFNDVVFDVYYGAANAAKIVVKAAGGTLPLRIKVGPGTSESDYVEVHGLWGEATNIMINTNASYANSKSGLGDKEVPLKYAVNDATDARDKIIIEVEKKNEQGTVQWIPMDAAVGEPAAKFACSPDLRWANERESLLDNTDFKDWVQGAIRTWQWNANIK